MFVARGISAFTGLLFTVMVAKWLDASSFGVWEVILTLVTLSGYPVGVVTFWATRDVARGRMAGRTAMLAGTLLSGLGIALYFGFTFFTYSRIASSILPFLLGSLLVPLSYWSGITNSIVSGFKPGVYGYSLLISEAAKLSVAYEALFVYQEGIEGVILALIASYFVQSAVSTYFVRLTFSEHFEAARLRRWTRLAWLPAFSNLSTMVAIADTYVAALFFGTTLVGYYQVAFLIAGIVGYTSSLTIAAYPLLLRGGSERIPAVVMEFVLLFSIPMAAGCIAIPGPILHLFRPEYAVGAEGLSILGVMSLFFTISGVLDQTLLGTEKADATERPRFRDLLRSNLLFVPVANTLYALTYVGSLYLVLSYGTEHSFSMPSLVAAWATVQLLATVVYVVVKARRARRFAKLMPGVGPVHYLMAAGVMAVVVYAIAPVVAAQNLGTLAYGVRLLGLVFLAAVVYFGLVFALDRKFRDLTRSLTRRI